MDLKRLFLEQLEREGDASRKAIERMPEGQNGWKPHPKSMELGYLASLVATMPGWVAFMIETDELDLNGNGKSFRTKAVDSREELLAQLDEGLTKARCALERTTEEHLLKPWKLTMGPQVLSYRPRYTSIADGALAHLAHHRGQLTVYLRLNEAKVPAIYGPSADEWN
jgi:uncharacterized damage-inducible protein DinB